MDIICITYISTALCVYSLYCVMCIYYVYKYIFLDVIKCVCRCAKYIGISFVFINSYKWPSIKDVRKILLIFDPLPSPPGQLASAIRIHKEKISTMSQLLVITFMPSSPVWVMVSIRSLPNFLSWLGLTRSLTFLRESDLGAKFRG